MARIHIPDNVEDLITLAEAIDAKQNPPPTVPPAAPGPLAGLDDWPKRTETIAQAREWHDKAEELTRQAGAAYEERDRLLNQEGTGVRDTVRQSRNILEGLYLRALKKLGDWGFTVTGPAEGGGKATPPAGGTA